MKRTNTSFLAALVGGLLAVGNLSAGSVTLTLPDYNDGMNAPVQRIDTLTITLDNTDGNGVGQFIELPGNTIHFGFTASFSSNVGDWLAISSIDYDGAQSLGTFTGGGAFYLGPVDVTRSAGTYDILSTALPTASELGNLVFNFDITHGNPDLGDGVDTQSFSVAAAINVDTPVDTGATPEPSTWMTLASGAGLMGLYLRRRR